MPLLSSVVIGRRYFTIYILSNLVLIKRISLNLAELAQQSVEQQMNQQQFAHGGNYMGAQQPMWHGGYMEGTQQPAMTMTTPAQLPPHIAAQAMLPQGNISQRRRSVLGLA